MDDLITKGTLSDRIAALALKVQESPFHNLSALDALVEMANRKEQRTAQLALEALKDLFINNLLPDRKLVPLSARGCLLPTTQYQEGQNTKKRMNMKIALLMYFEDELKKRVEQTVVAIENGMKSMVEFFKRICMSTAAELLKSKPEQEARLLALLVGRLGDSSSRISSKCMELLKDLLHFHPVMKAVVVREVRQLIYKQSTGKIHAVFTSVVFLSQIVLSVMDASSAAVAGQLVECYMSLFERALQQGEMGSRLLAALLTGVNKALPYLRSIEPIVQHVDALFKMVDKILPTKHNHLIANFIRYFSRSLFFSYLYLIYGRIYRSIRRRSRRPFSRWLCYPI